MSGVTLSTPLFCMTSTEYSVLRTVPRYVRRQLHIMILHHNTSIIMPLCTSDMCPMVEPPHYQKSSSPVVFFFQSDAMAHSRGCTGPPNSSAESIVVLRPGCYSPSLFLAIDDTCFRAFLCASQKVWPNQASLSPWVLHF